MMLPMFRFGSDPVRPELVAAFERAWGEISAPGTWWTGRRVAIAQVARDARTGSPAPADGLPEGAVEAAQRVAADPAHTTEAWVTGTCAAIGELRYIELVSVVTRVVAIDTFHRLAGHPLPPLPRPLAGEPTRAGAPDGLLRNHTWVAMAMPVPPFVLGAVPAAMEAMLDLTDLLYMPMDEMSDPDWRRGDLHRTQVELVAATMSHANQCFY